MVAGQKKVEHNSQKPHTEKKNHKQNPETQMPPLEVQGMIVENPENVKMEYEFMPNK